MARKHPGFLRTGFQQEGEKGSQLTETEETSFRLTTEETEQVGKFRGPGRAFGAQMKRINRGIRR